MTRSRPVAWLAGMLALASVVSACGQKGALYLPEEPRTTVPATGAIVTPSPPTAPEDPDLPANKRTP